MTAEHDRYRDDVAAYALGALTRVGAAGLERHLPGCEACSSDLARFCAVVETLPMTVEPQTPRRQLKHEVLQRIHSERSPPSRESSFSGRVVRPPLPAVAAVLAAAAILAGGFVLGSSVSGIERQELRAAVDQTYAPGVSASFVRQGDLGVLRVSKLAPPDKGVYVLWVDRGAGPVFVSSFTPSSGGRAEVGVTDLNHVRRMTVTREAAAHVGGPTTRALLTVRLR